MQLGEHLLDALPVQAVEEEDLDRGEGLDVDVGPHRLDPLQHVREVGEGQVGVEAAHDVHLAHRPGLRRDRLHHLVDRHRVGPRLVLLRREGAEVAGGDAHVRVVDVGVPHEVRRVPVALLPDVVRELPEAEQVVGPVEGDPVLEREPLPGEDLLADGLECGVVHAGGARRLDHRPLRGDTAAGRTPRLAPGARERQSARSVRSDLDRPVAAAILLEALRPLP